MSKWSDNLVGLERCFAPQRRTFFICHLASWLGARRFSEPTFPASGGTNHGGSAVFRDFLTFWLTCIFFLLTFSGLLLLDILV